ncbi:MAG: RluA family pseudouridine synthase, partial [Calothrix sp. SM1_5_4]|nr:RluA family pseudouridine synthase [Calothrix sp. SM1_5_4]
MPAKSLRQIEVPESGAGLRLDKFLATLEFIPSRTRAAELIERGHVHSGGRPLKAAHKVRAGELLTV